MRRTHHIVVLLVLCGCLFSTATSESLRSSSHRRLSPRNFTLWTAADIAATVDRWGEHYPNLLRVFTAQEAYGLPAAGSAEDCPFDDGVIGCFNRVMVLQDYTAHPEGSDSALLLPHVLWSGELHGDERVGPTAVMEATKLLLEATACEGLPRESIRDDADAWAQEVQRAASCRQELREEYGLTDSQRRWMARLATTRRLVIVPTANALGYFQSTRTEAHIDPNRDFPYDSSDQCMETIAARTLNEVFRDHIFQLSLTFHGGMEIIGYEWGAPNYLGEDSPDDLAQKDIAKAYSDFAGGFDGTRPYAYGPMNDQVYPVHGGMEDWAYAASWDPERVIPCNPKTYSGYAAEKTVYTEASLRCYNMLVETSNTKIPHIGLGSSAHLLDAQAANNGHVTRNARLALMALELVEPYVKIEVADGVVFSDDIVPLALPTCRHLVAPAKANVPIEWTVSGAISVDETELYVMDQWNDSMSSTMCSSQPADPNMLFNLLTSTAGPQKGKRGDTFQSLVDLSSFRDGDTVALIARARVDEAWLVGEPKAHIVHARRHPNYHFESPSGVLQGRLEWFSQPLVIHITSSSSYSVERQVRFDGSATPTAGGDATSEGMPFQGETHSPSSSPSFHPGRIVLITSLLLLGVFIGRRFFDRFLRRSRLERIRDFIEDEDALSPGMVEFKGGVLS